MIPGDKENTCYICGRVGHMDRHHMMHGTANRRMAEKYGLVVHLCHTCHMNVHDNPDRFYDEALMIEAQRIFEETHSRDEWRRAFGKSRL